MNISKFFTGTVNRAKTLQLPEKYAKEVRELCADITGNTPYKEVKVNIIDKNNAQIIGTEGKNNSLTVNLDFAGGTQNQVEKTKSWALLPWLSVRENIQEIRGTITGTIKRIKNTHIAREEDWSNYIKTTDYENCISGNKFRREETPRGVKFYRNIDGDWVEMFTNKNK